MGCKKTLIDLANGLSRWGFPPKPPPAFFFWLARVKNQTVIRRFYRYA